MHDDRPVQSQSLSAGRKSHDIYMLDHMVCMKTLSHDIIDYIKWICVDIFIVTEWLLLYYYYCYSLCAYVHRNMYGYVSYFQIEFCFIVVSFIWGEGKKMVKCTL